MAATIPPPPSHRRPTPDHPPYAEMVQCALTTLAEPNGSTESSISAFIQENYTSLPWGHSKLLPYYLNKLLIAGEIQRSDFDPNCYVLPDDIASSREEKSVKNSVTGVSEKNEGLQGEVQVKRGRGRRRKYKGICSEKTILRENAEKGRKGFVLKFKRKCAEGGGNTSDDNWMFSKDETREEVDGSKEKALDLQEESFDDAECNLRKNKKLARPTYKSSDMKIEEKGEEKASNEKNVELREKGKEGIELHMQNENLSALQEKDFGDMKIDVNGEEMLPLQEKDRNTTKIDETILVLQDKNCSSSTIEGNDNEMLPLPEKYLDSSFNKCNENVVMVQEKGKKGVKFNMQNESLLGLQEKNPGDMQIDTNGEETLPSNEQDCGATKIDEMIPVLQHKNYSSSTIAENHDEMLAFQENYLDGSSIGRNGKVVVIALQKQDVKGVRVNMQNDNLLGLQEKDSGYTKAEERDGSAAKIDVNDEMISVLQDKNCSLSTIAVNDNDGSFNECNEKVVALQENDTKGVELNMQNDNVLALQEKDFGDMKVDVNGEETLALREKDCSTTKIDENDERILKSQDINCSSNVTADNGDEINESNESSLWEESLNVGKNEQKGSLLATEENVGKLLQVAVPSVEKVTPSNKSSMKSEIDTSSKKSKTKKSRKLWFES